MAKQLPLLEPKTEAFSQRSPLSAASYPPTTGKSSRSKGVVAIDGRRGVVLESGGDKFSGRLRGMDIADPRLRVSFKLLKVVQMVLPAKFPEKLKARSA